MLFSKSLYFWSNGFVFAENNSWNDFKERARKSKNNIDDYFRKDNYRSKKQLKKINGKMNRKDKKYNADIEQDWHNIMRNRKEINDHSGENGSRIDVDWDLIDKDNDGEYSQQHLQGRYSNQQYSLPSPSSSSSSHRYPPNFSYKFEDQQYSADYYKNQRYAPNYYRHPPDLANRPYANYQSSYLPPTSDSPYSPKPFEYSQLHYQRNFDVGENDSDQ